MRMASKSQKKGSPPAQEQSLDFSMSKKRRDSVRVRVITTEFVRTDAANFKSVVQSLTGRDSTVTATIAETGESSNISRKKVKCKEACNEEEVSCLFMAPPNLPRSEELEKVSLELPSFDDFHGFWGDQIRFLYMIGFLILQMVRLQTYDHMVSKFCYFFFFSMNRVWWEVSSKKLPSSSIFELSQTSYASVAHFSWKMKMNLEQE